MSHASCLLPLSSMIVLGIDPGTRTAGFGVIEIENRNERALDFGTIDLPDGMDHTLRLRTIYDRILELVDHHLPDEVEPVDRLFAEEEFSSFFHGPIRSELKGGP